MRRPDYSNQEALLPSAAPPGFTDHIYASPHGVPLEVRVWACPGAAPSPWIFWTHGGAYCTGAHYAPPSWVVPAFRAKGFHVVSVGYRLSPQVGLQEMIQDCVDGLEWCRRNLPSIVPIDIDAFAIGGDSSGGTLATLLGHIVRPRPHAVCDVYGPVDLVDMYYTRKAKVPDDAWAQRWGDRYTDSHNRAMIADRDPAKAITAAPFGWEINHVPIEQTRARWARPDFEYSTRVFAQTQLKDWLASMGLGLTALLRLDELQHEEDKLERCRKWSAYHLLDKTYPPTAFFHGEADGAVPITASRRMAQRLKEHSVDVYESYYPDGLHGFDQELKGADTEGWAEYVVPVVEFVDRHVRGM
ncbi:hypothetical protein JCM24511_09238 [Saitozyma sp. JCM 24511]|nr:hypothetical protein JCM24511_09238 [Saitozyma sp. JCM 24511]